VNPALPFAIVPQQIKVLPFENYMPVPMRVRKDIRFTDSPSFIDYFNIFKDAYKPRVFCHNDEDGMEVMAVLDFDGPGTVIEPPSEGNPRGRVSSPQPMWNSHRITLQLAYHPDYKALKEQDSQWLDQQDFALFIEENTHLFSNPDGATMLELAQHLKGVRNASWQAGKRLSNGETKLEYIETIEARAVRNDVVVPDYLELVRPIYDGYETQTYKAAFRWRMEGPKVLFSYRLLTKLAERAALDSVKLDLVKGTGLPLYNVSTFSGIVSSSS
jgi:hypothetical protein